jgi:5-methylthioadenosine/S-adenosylhomocysteine deaminase
MKEKVDLVLIGGTIVTMDTNRRIIENGAVAIRENKILSVDRADTVQEKYTAEKTIDAKHMAVTPGLIDCHTHNLQIFLRGISWSKPPKVPVWVNVLIPFESALKKDEAHLSALLSCINMVKVGTTCHLEHGGQFNADEVGRAVDTTGVRGILGTSTVDMGVPENFRTTTEECVKRNIALVERWNRVNERIRAWFSLRQIIVDSEELWPKFKELAAKYKVGLQTHLAEGIYEVDYCMAKWGRRPVEHLFDTGFLGPNVVIAHAMYLTMEEVGMLQQRNVKVAHCPSGNLNRTRVAQMLAQNVTVGLGSDGGARRGLDLFREMRVVSTLNRVSGIPQYDDLPLTDQRIFEMATINGAKALLWDKEIGSIEPGKKADIILVNLNKPHIVPVADIYNTLVQRVTGPDVDTVIIDGKVIMQHGEIKTVNEQEILEKVGQTVPNIIRRLGW